MAKPNEQLAESLATLRVLQEGGRRIFRSNELSRVHRERLVRNGFMQEVIKGWLISAGPSAWTGDSTPWSASFGEFCAIYCNERFGDQWHLSAEQSLCLQAEKTVIPDQVVVNSPKGSDNLTKIPFETSIYDLKAPAIPMASDLVIWNGLRLFSPAASLVRINESFVARNPVETQVELTHLCDVSNLFRLLLNGGHSAKAGWLGHCGSCGGPVSASYVAVLEFVVVLFLLQVFEVIIVLFVVHSGFPSRPDHTSQIASS